MRKSLGDEAWKIRLTPRRKGSRWSEINIKRAKALIAEGRMAPAGKAAFEARDPEDARRYAYEREMAVFAPDEEKRFRAEAGGLDLLGVDAAVVSQAGGLVGGQRQAARDARKASRNPDNRLRRGKEAPVTFDDVRIIAMALPGVQESTYYGTPAFKVAGKAFTRLREDGTTLVLFDVPFEEREVMCEADPEIYHFTDHYRDWPAVLARLPAAAPEHVKGYLERSWRKRAPKAVLKAAGL